MALIPGTGTDSMGKDIYNSMGIAAFIDSLPDDAVPDKPATKEDAIEKIADFADAVIAHYKDNAEIKNVATNTANSGALIPGDLISAAIGQPTVHVPVTGALFSSTGAGTQTGSGTIK